MVIFLLVSLSSFWLKEPISTPSKITLPAVGRSSIFMHRTRVLFPAPLMPIIPYISPSFIVSETFFSASTSPDARVKVLVRFFISIIFSPHRPKIGLSNICANSNYLIKQLPKQTVA